MNERIKAAAGSVAIAIVQVLGMFGLTMSDSWVGILVCVVAMLIALGIGIWNNFNFTEAAGIAQQILDAMKRYNAEIIEQAKELAAKAVEDEAIDKAAHDARE